MLLTDASDRQVFAASFSTVAGGGAPVMFRHIFRLFAHPEVHILSLPAFGLVSEIAPTFLRKALFGPASMIYATLSAAFLSAIVRAHPMFIVGTPVVE